MATRMVITGTARLGANATLKAIPDGRKVVEMSGAVENYKGETEWHRISLFGTRAENLVKYLTKGTLIMFTGSPTAPRAWQRQDGTTAASYDIIATDIQLLSAQKRDESEVPAAEAEAQPDGVTVAF